MPTESSDPTGKKSRVCRSVNAATVPSEMSPANGWPANQYTSAGMTEKEVWMDAITQRPAMRCRTSSSASPADSRSKRSASSSPRPIVFPSRIPETESDSSTSADMSASVR